MTIYEFSQQVFALKKAKKFDEALAFFKENKHNVSTEDIAKNKYLIDAMISSLRKTGQAQFVNDFLREYNIPINETTEEQVLNAYGWAVYDNIKSQTIPKYQIIDMVQYVIHLLSMKNSIYSYSVISNIFRIGLQVAKEHQNQDYQFTNDFCDMFDINVLTLETHSFEVGGKNIEQASDKEKWYSEKSKALHELGQHQKCYEISDEALHAIDKFHNNSDLWFARRIALSQKALGNLDEAIEKLQNVYKRKREWFIQKEIAELYFEKKDIETAFKHCSEALNTKGKLEFKIGLISLMGKILKEKNELELAQKHFLLIKKIREDHGWKIPEELQMELNNITQDSVDTKELISELNRYWKSLQPKQEHLAGIIKKILHDNDKGKNGFIKTENEDFYFTLPRHIKFIDDIEEGTKVKFEVVELADGKKKAKILMMLK